MFYIVWIGVDRVITIVYNTLGSGFMDGMLLGVGEGPFPAFILNFSFLNILGSAGEERLMFKKILSF
jgi:hypothetical protein